MKRRTARPVALLAVAALLAAACSGGVDDTADPSPADGTIGLGGRSQPYTGQIRNAG